MADHKKVLSTEGVNAAVATALSSAVSDLNTQLTTLITAIANPQLLETQNVSVSAVFGAAAWHVGIAVGVGYQG